MNLKVFIVVSGFFNWLGVVFSLNQEMTTMKNYKCNEEEFIHEIENVQITDPHNIVKIAANKQISHFCKNLKIKLDNLEDYIHACKIEHIKNQHKRIITGAESLHYFLCVSTIYRKEFVRYAPCYEKIFDDFNDCELPSNMPTNWADEREQIKLCSAYKKLVDCHTIKATIGCGPSAADIYRRFLINLITSSMLIDCGPNLIPIGPDVSKYQWNILVYISFIYLTIIITLICIIICLCLSI